MGRTEKERSGADTDPAIEMFLFNALTKVLSTHVRQKMSHYCALCAAPHHTYLCACEVSGIRAISRFGPPAEGGIVRTMILARAFAASHLIE
jgi:hypothetical protein